MDAVEVVAAEVVVEVALEPGEAQVEVAGEGGAPAFLEDGLVPGFDGAVGLRAAGADAGVAGAERSDRRAEGAGAKLAAVVGEEALELPAGGAKLGGDSLGELGSSA